MRAYYLMVFTLFANLASAASVIEPKATSPYGECGEDKVIKMVDCPKSSGVTDWSPRCDWDVVSASIVIGCDCSADALACQAPNSSPTKGANCTYQTQWVPDLAHQFYGENARRDCNNLIEQERDFFENKHCPAVCAQITLRLRPTGYFPPNENKIPCCVPR